MDGGRQFGLAIATQVSLRGLLFGGGLALLALALATLPLPVAGLLIAAPAALMAVMAQPVVAVFLVVLAGSGTRLYLESCQHSRGNSPHSYRRWRGRCLHGCLRWD